MDEYVENDKKELKKALELLGKGEEQNTVYLPESAKKTKEKYSSYLGGIRSLTIALEKNLGDSIDSRIDALYALTGNILSNIENQIEYEEKILALEKKNKDLEERLEGLEVLVKMPKKIEEPKSQEATNYPKSLTPPPLTKPEIKPAQNQSLFQNSELAKLKEELLENLNNLKKVMNR